MGVELVGERDARGAIIERERGEPIAMSERSGAAWPGEHDPAPEWQLREAMAAAYEIAANVFTRTDQIAELLLLDGVRR